MISLVGGFSSILSELTDRMRSARPVEQDRWQGIDVRNNPAARCYELERVALEVDLEGIEDLQWWRSNIQPNLPWADNHFAERVSGKPLNPGVEWANWPWGKSAVKFRDPNELFNHSYPERLWPKYARRTEGGRLPLVEGRGVAPEGQPLRGIALQVGDLLDLVDLLVRDPHTRQAWIPLFFPEDTGWADGGRKPCTLGYQFILRRGRLGMYYPLRSCDLVRHLRDDCYMAVRLLLWVLNRCQERDAEKWGPVVPGVYSMWMTSLHVFENDMIQLKKELT